MLNDLQIYIYHSSGPDVFSFHDASVSLSKISSDAFWGLPKEGSRLQDSSIQAPLEAQRLLAGDEEYVFPVARSASTGRWAAGVVARHSHTYAKAVVVVSHRGQRLQASAGYSVAALAWNADASLLAVLEDTYETKVRSVRDFVSPHPVPYKNILLTVYDVRSDNVACQSLLLRDARYAASKIAWR